MNYFSQAKPISKAAFFVGVLLIIIAAYSQYVITGLTAATSALLVYGVPIVIISLVAGSSVIKKAFHKTGKAFSVGMDFLVLGAITVMLLMVGSFLFSKIQI